MLTETSLLRMHPLSQRRENEEEILIGREDISEFVVLPDIGVEIIEMLHGGMSIGDVAKVMEERLGEPVDVLDFANDLIVEYRFVQEVDGQVIDPPVERKDHMPWVTERMGQFFFSRTAFLVYLLVFASGLAAALYKGGVFPSYEDLFVSRYVTVTAVAAFLLGWVTIFLHETAHLLAARSLGIGSRISLSHRFLIVVAETNMSNIVLVPPEKRYRAYWAGMAWDVALFGIGVWLLVLNGAFAWGMEATAVGLIKMLNLLLLFRLMFQFEFFLQTDLYYVLTTKWKCLNLLANTKLFLRRKYWKISASEEEMWQAVDEAEKRVVGWYAWLFVIGYAFVALMFVAFTLPVAWEFIQRILSGMGQHSVASWPFWDGMILLVLAVVPFALLVMTVSRSFMQNRRERARRKQLAS